jgi:hypothetical protein
VILGGSASRQHTERRIFAHAKSVSDATVRRRSDQFCVADRSVIASGAVIRIWDGEQAETGSAGRDWRRLQMAAQADDLRRDSRPWGGQADSAEQWRLLFSCWFGEGMVNYALTMMEDL